MKVQSFLEADFCYLDETKAKFTCSERTERPLNVFDIKLLFFASECDDTW